MMHAQSQAVELLVQVLAVLQDCSPHPPKLTHTASHFFRKVDSCLDNPALTIFQVHTLIISNT